MDKYNIWYLMHDICGSYGVSNELHDSSHVADNRSHIASLDFVPGSDSTSGSNCPPSWERATISLSHAENIPTFSAHQIPWQPCRMLFTQGDQSLLSLPRLGVVGPRKMSAYGKRVVDYVVQSAQKFSCCIVSWGAPWVDRYVHDQAMRTGIPVIVVLGWGIAAYHLSSSRAFLEQVVRSGWLILSEFQLREEPKKYTFPLRNRIIAGLSDVLFVPEAWEKSWSLITVDYAIDAWVPVYTATHDIFSHTSRGMAPYLQTWTVKPVIDIEVMMAAHFTCTKKESEVLSSFLPPDLFSSPPSGPQTVSEYLVADMMRQLL
jgi:DNA protecting protein DprA